MRTKSYVEASIMMLPTPCRQPQVAEKSPQETLYWYRFQTLTNLARVGRQILPVGYPKFTATFMLDFKPFLSNSM